MDTEACVWSEDRTLVSVRRCKCSTFLINELSSSEQIAWTAFRGDQLLVIEH